MALRNDLKELILAADQSHKERDYWLTKLYGDLVKSHFPYDSRAVGKQRDMTAQCIDFQFTGEHFARLMKVSNRSDVRLYVIMVTGLVVMLYKYTSSRDIIVGIPTYKQEVEGELINTVLALRNRVDPARSCKELLLQVAQDIFEANENQNYPIEALLHKLGMSTEGDDFPLFDTAILLNNLHDPRYLRHIPINMTFSFHRGSESVDGVLEYNKALFNEDSARKIAAHFKCTLEEILFNIDSPVSCIRVLTPAERMRLLFDFNNNKAEFSRDKTICRFFEEQADKNPDCVSLVFNDLLSTFGELNHRVNRLTNYLLDKGVREDHTVAILLQRSAFIVESILAVWKAGAAYIPIEPGYPISRTIGILEDAGSKILISRGEFIHQELKNNYKGIIIDLEKSGFAAAPQVEVSNPKLKINMNSLAYVIYTSGSTGKPKGAMVEHIGMMNHIGAKINDLDLSGRSVIAQNASHTFDISVWQFFTALTLGGQTVIYPAECILVPGQFLSRLIRDRVTILEVVPSYLSVLLDFIREQGEHAVLMGLAYLLVTGEEIKPALAKKWFEIYPDTPMVNAYGPTEASDDITHYIMIGVPQGDRIPIGRPLQNFNIYIVDENMNLCPVGVKGEICVSGIGVGRGYLNNPGLTAEKFIAHELHELVEEKKLHLTPDTKHLTLYRTGDLARWLPDGTIEFFGRKDCQVKVRGFRIELGEIENKLSSCPGIKDAVVIDRDDDRGNKYLCAYVVVESPAHADVPRFREYLQERLPEYMIPPYFVLLEGIPLTPNGKVDRRALPAPDLEERSPITYITVEMLEQIGYNKPGAHGLPGEIMWEDLDDVAEISRNEEAALAACSREKGEKYYPLGHSQKMVYYVEKTYVGTSCESDGDIILYTGEFHREQLERAINTALYRNESLRTRVKEIEYGDFLGPAQYIVPHSPHSFDYVEFSGKEGKKNLGKWVARDLDKPFRFIDGELYYFAIFKLDHGRYGYYIKLHHIISDANSLALLLREIDTIYRDLLKVNPVDNTLNPYYIRYILDEKEYLYSSRLKNDRQYWLDSLLPLPGEVEIGSKRGDAFHLSGSSMKLVFTDDLRSWLHAYRKNHRTSLYKLILSALSIYVFHVTGLEDFVIGTLNHGRWLEHHRSLFGMFINFIPARIKIDPDMEYHRFLEKLGAHINDIIKNHSRYPGDLLSADLKKITGRDTRYFWNITLIGHPDSEKESFHMEHFSSNDESTPLVIHINCSNKDIEGILELEWVYQVEQFSPGDIECIHDRLVTILTQALDDPGKKLSGFEFLSEEEKKQVPTVSGNDGAVLETGKNRIETLEIEDVLQGYEPVQKAAALVKKTENGVPCLCVYVVAGNRLTTDELHEYLFRRLPLEGVPAHFLQLEQMPVTAAGEVDRHLLETIDINRHTSIGEPAHGYEAPGSELEEKLVDIWQNVLGKDKIGVNDNFFTIGGDSIKTIQIASRLSKAGYKLEMKDIFQHPTIAELAPLLKKSDRTACQSAVSGIVPLTPTQEKFFESPAVALHHFNQAVMLHLQVKMEAEGVRAVFLKLQEHHDALRMTYKKENGRFIQTCHPLDYPTSLEVHDFRRRNRSEAVQLLEKKANEIQRSIDLEKGPLIKPVLFHLDDGDRLLIVVHHLVVDGVSWRILFEDIDILIQQYKNGEKLSLPLKTDSFKLWAEKLVDYANSEPFLKEKAYWAESESREVRPIEKDFEDGDNYLEDAETLSFSLGEEETRLLLTKANGAFGTEINDILLTALGLGFKRAAGCEKLSIALEGHGREEILPGVDIKRTVGWFTSVYPVVLDLSYQCDGENPGRQIKEIKETLHRVPQKGIGYGILRYLTDKKYKENIDFKLNPQVSFNYLGQFDADIRQTSFKPAGEESGRTRDSGQRRWAELEVEGITANKRLVMAISFSKKQYKKETVETILRCYKEELSRIISYCVSKQVKELTPSDLTYKKLSIEKLDELAHRYPIEDIYPLTPLQEGMLFHALYDKTSSVYFEQASYRLQGKLNITYVEKSINELFKRREILRTAFIYEGLERPLQLVLKQQSVDFMFRDIRNVYGAKGMSDSQKKLYIRQFREKARQRPFDLSNDVLMRTAVLQTDDDGYEFIWSFHHILMDGWCTPILIAEFFEIYNSYLQNCPPQLSEAVPYRNYIEWLEKQDKQRSANYWTKYLEGYEEIAVVPKTSISKRNPGEYKKETFSFKVTEDKVSQLNNLAGRSSVTLNTIIQTLWGIILGKYNCKEDVVFGAVVSGRPSELEGVESMVGLFINAVPVRIRYTGDSTFRSLLEKVRQNAVDCDPHQYYSLAEIQSRSALKQGLLDHILVYENYPVAEQLHGAARGTGAKENNVKLQISNVEIFEQANYDFGLIVSPGKWLTITFHYNGNVIEREFAERAAGHFNRVIEQVLDNEELCVGEFTLLSGEEKNRLLFEFNETDSDYPETKTLHELFEEQAARTPDSVGLVDSKNRTGETVQLTYGELNKRSDQLAHHLQEKSVGPDTIVGIKMERCVEMIVGILGILKAGGAYLPIDPNYPQGRIDFMLKDSGAKILLTELPEGHHLHHSSNLKQFIPHHSGAIAYVIYTSGTTGWPKGVILEHRSAVNTLLFRKEVYQMGLGDISLQLFSYAFDGFVTSFFTPVISGAAVVLLNEKEVKDINRIKDAIIKHKITHFISIPVLFQAIIEMLTEEETVSLKEITLAGDKVSPHLIEMAREKSKNIEISIEYGVTESAVMSTIYRQQTKDPIIKIGAPIWNTRIYILDRYLELQPIGIPGELYISAVGLARGYLNNPELTAEKFLHLTLNTKHLTLYKSGDLARWLADGNLEFSGRIDSQVKIRGYRIELGEIERCLISHEKIKTAVVAAAAKEATNDHKEQYLCAYIVPGKEIELSELREYLSAKLPNYMIPSYFKQVERIPVTPNGKVDYKALEISGHLLDSEIKYTAPGNEMEKIIADIWKQVLERGKIGVHDNFFEIGGNSIKIVVLQGKLNEALKTNVSIPVLFEYVTIRSLVQYLSRRKTGEEVYIPRDDVDISKEPPGEMSKIRDSRFKRKARRRGSPDE